MKTAKRILLYGIPKSLLIKIILALVIILIGRNVFALDYNVSSNITSPQGSGRTGTYTGLEITNTGTSNLYNINTRYDGNLSRITFNMPLPDNWEDGDCYANNVEYRVTLNMLTNDWSNSFGSVFVGSSSSSNQNYSNGRVTFVSNKQIYFTFKIPSGSTFCNSFVYVDLKSSNLSSTPFTRITNWNLSSVILTDPTVTSGSGGSSGSGSSSSSNQDIINNANDNANNIIENNNDNTSNIIENNNQNTQDIINSNKENFQTCRESVNLFDKSNITAGWLYYQDNSLRDTSSTTYYTSDYIPVKPNTTYSLDIVDSTSMGSGGIMQYNSSKEWISPGIPEKSSTFTFTTSSNTHYVRFSFRYSSRNEIQFQKGSSITSYEPYGEICTNKLDDISNGLSVIDGAISGAQQGIITNNNNNTDKEIASQKVCKNSKFNFYYQDYTSGFYLKVDGSLGYDSTSSITDYVEITPDSDYIITNTGDSMNVASFCLYDKYKSIIICEQYSRRRIVSFNSGNAYFFRTTLAPLSSQPTSLSGKICKNGNQAVSDNISDLNDSINNSNVDSGTGSDFFDSFHTDDNGGISAIVTKPLTIVNNLLSNNNTCSNLNLPEFMGATGVYLPSGCILWNNAPSTVITLWNIFVCGFGAYYILKDLFKIIENLKNPDNDRVEVLDL